MLFDNKQIWMKDFPVVFSVLIALLFFFCLSCNNQESTQNANNPESNAVGYIQPTDTVRIIPPAPIFFNEDTFKRIITTGQKIKHGRPLITKSQLAPDRQFTTEEIFFNRKSAIINTPGKEGIPLPKIIDIPKNGAIVQYGDSIFAPQSMLAINPEPITGATMAIKESPVYNMKYLNVTQGLSSSYLYFCEEDSRGHLWIGTYAAGVCRYDGSNIINYTEKEGIVENTVKAFLEDSNGNLWFGTNGGVSKFDGRFFTNFTTREGLSGNVVRVILEDSEGNIWFGTNNGICKFNGSSFTHYTEEQGLPGNDIWSMTINDKGEIWSFAYGQGLSHFDGESFLIYEQTKEFDSSDINCLQFHEDGTLWVGAVKELIAVKEDSIIKHSSYFFNNNEIFWDISFDDQDNLWITSLIGLFKFDGSRFTNMSISEGLIDRNIRSVYLDKEGNLWLTSYGGGLMKLNPNHFVNYSEKIGLPSSSVQGIHQDKEKNYWFTTAAGLVKYNGFEFATYTSKEGFVPNRGITITEDSAHNLWITNTSNTIGLIKYDGSHFIYFDQYQGLPGGPQKVLEAKDGNLWIGFMGDGLYKFDGEAFIPYQGIDKILDEGVFLIFESSEGTLWVGAWEALFSFNGQFFRKYTMENGLPDNFISAIGEDHSGNIWIGTEKGLCKFSKSDPESDDFDIIYRYTKEGGLTHDLVHTITQDPRGALWIGSERGINQLSVTDSGKEDLYLLNTYLAEDGLIGTDVWPSADYLDASDNMWWGTSRGIIQLDLKTLSQDKKMIKPALSHIKINQEFIDFSQLSDPNFTPKIPSNKYLRAAAEKVSSFSSLPSTLTLPYKLNHLTFHFNAKTWTARHKIKYSYRMKGLSNKWSQISAENKADYQNLPPGSYTFQLKAIGANSEWSVPLEYSFVVLPPWWRSWWAYSLYVLLIGGVIFSIYRFQLYYQLKKQEAENLKQIDDLKTKLYANITHEFRTPLTIILGMIDQVEKHPKNWLKEGVQMIRSNGKNLLNLVNQMLELQKLEFGNLTVDMQQGDIIPLLQSISKQFEAFAYSSQQQLEFNADVENLNMDHDPEVILRIVSNLLSNAIKYSPEKGLIKFSVSSGTHPAITTNQCLIMTIEDKGPGIPPNQLPYIFDRFYRADSPTKGTEAGTGIGLSLTLELVKLLDGKIEVSSQLGEGTTFQVFLPITQQAKPFQEEDSSKIQAAIFGKKGAFKKESPPADNLPVALVVEDNIDIAKYLQICLQGSYQLEFAQNGQEGINKALELTPDIIISDVMMPEKDGFELCDTLKEDIRTSHIPIILLTAKSDVASRIVGLKRGADDYLAKPFNEEELLIRMQNLLEIRRKLQERYQNVYEQPLPKVKTTNPNVEDAFILKLKDIFEEKMIDPEFNLDGLSKELGLSRSNLYRKIKALTGRSPAVYLRSLRLQRARQMLLSSELSVKEVAYDVGFSNPYYFSNSYSDEFGESPSNTRDS